MAAQPQEETVEVLGSPQTEAVHQSLRREVNEQIASVNHDLGVVEDDTVEVICECVHPRCTGLIDMPISEYEAVRRFPTHFFVKAGHEVAESERVVAESDGYVVIEATGRAGLRAVASDPRRRRAHSVESER
jgi:hypothetical protein